MKPQNFTRTSVPIHCTAVTRYDGTSYLRLELWKLREKDLKMPPLMASGRISPEWYKRGSQNFTHLSGTANLTNLRNMTSLAASGLPQNATKCCTKVRNNGSGRQRVKYFARCLTWNYQILHGHRCRLALQPHQI